MSKDDFMVVSCQSYGLMVDSRMKDKQVQLMLLGFWLRDRENSDSCGQLLVSLMAMPSLLNWSKNNPTAAVPWKDTCLSKELRDYQWLIGWWTVVCCPKLYKLLTWSRCSNHYRVNLNNLQSNMGTSWLAVVGLEPAHWFAIKYGRGLAVTCTYGTGSPLINLTTTWRPEKSQYRPDLFPVPCPWQFTKRASAPTRSWPLGCSAGEPSRNGESAP